MRSYLATEVRRVLRSRRLLALTAAYPAVLYLVFGTTLDDGTKSEGLSVAANVMVAMALFGATGAALAVSGAISAEREAGWTRQLRLTPLPGWAYVLGKVLVALISALAAIITVFVVARFTGVGSLPLSNFTLAAAVLLVGMPPFAALGIFFGYLAVGQANRPIMMFSWMGLSIFGGLWVPLDSMPTAMQNIAHATPTYQLLEMSRHALTGTSVSITGLGVLVAWTLGAAALAAWRYRSDTVSASSALA
jgi:ABC-2 type transport system permease protein